MKKLKKYSLYFIITLAVLAYVFFSYLPNSGISAPKEGEAAMYAIDVGEADCTLFVMPDGKNILIDAAGTDDYYTILTVLNELEIRKIDVLVLTHPHMDHMGSMARIISSYDIGGLFMPDAASDSEEFENILAEAKKKGVAPSLVSAGSVIYNGEYKISVLSPEDKDYGDENLFSAVIRIDFGNTSFIVTGDAETANEKAMIERYGDSLQADVLRIAHHGADTSSSYEFLEAVSPKYAVISVGADNIYGHPSKTVTDNIKKLGIQSFRTDTDGTVTFISDGEGIRVVCEK